jgi:glycosyltransferase involved in cell wall biosynthesis
MARILHVITDLDVGGAETMLYKLLSASSPAFEHRVVSLAPLGPMADRIAGLGVPVFSLDVRAAIPDPRRLWKLRSLSRQIAPDLIMGWMYHANLMASFAGWSVGNARVFWGVRGTLAAPSRLGWRTTAIIWLGGRLSRRPNAIIYPSHVARAQHEASGYHSVHSVTIPNGTDCARFVPDQRARAEVRAEFGLKDDGCVIGLVARCHPMKDHAGFLRAAAMVVRSHPRSQFLLVGRGVTRASNLRLLIQELGLQDRVVLADERSDVARINAALDIACSASAWGEAFSNALGEAMACAVPCVATNVGESAYLLGDAGITVPPGDPTALANAICQLISAGAEGRRLFGQKARCRIEERFSLPAVVARYEEFYRQHLSRDPSRSFNPEIENPKPSQADQLLTGGEQSR